MKRLLALTLAIVISFGVLSTNRTTVQAQKALKIGVVTDVGKVDDRSFNQSAWEGAQQGAQATGGTADYIETLSTDDYANNIQQFADKNYDIIITVGFALGDATTKAAQKYPNIKFLSVDNAAPDGIPNYTGLVFHEDQPGFLVGYLAAKLSKSKVIGGVYGFAVPSWPTRKATNSAPSWPTRA